MVDRIFKRTIGIDYSGGDTPNTRLAGLRVYQADGNAPPQEVRSPSNRFGRCNWNRREIADYLVDHLREEGNPTLVGIDHAFSFPIRYFREHELPTQGNLTAGNWDHFLNDFRKYWPTNGDNAKVTALRCGTGKHRGGDPRWRRLTDKRTGTAKSVFHFNVPGSVAHSTHAGIPWLLYVRRKLGDTVHFWPFDGWNIPERKSTIAEVYPSLWSRRFDPKGRTGDQHDAYSVAGWLSHADQNGCLAKYFNPNLSQSERDRANVEGWILGVQGYIDLGQDHNETCGSRE